ncbi:hypothetical protein CFC21_053034 [Triticum aestivum]|uniref:Uncharacterized protein n=4 Tax=Triticum TaxID=4564 RepID=A0A8R7U5J0_TRIUA|nr:hypothetical protein CFC21_053034 [Triticum aestivum]VAH93724.1 unnamed protein product [Triticum turgidum subsp. durum]
MSPPELHLLQPPPGLCSFFLVGAQPDEAELPQTAAEGHVDEDGKSSWRGSGGVRRGYGWSAEEGLCGATGPSYFVEWPLSSPSYSTRRTRCRHVREEGLSAVASPLPNDN